MEADQPRVRRTLSAVRGTRNASGEIRFEIDVPSTLQRGIVLGQNGVGVLAFVNVQTVAEVPRSEQFRTETDGSFEIAGLEPGTYRLQAEDRSGRSDIIELKIGGEEKSPIELTVRPSQDIEGRITAGGAAISGAEVSAYPRGVGAMRAEDAVSRTDGRFTIPLPIGTERADLLIAADGFPSILLQGETRSKEPLVIEIARPAGTLVADTPSDALFNLRRRGAEISVLQLRHSVQSRNDNGKSYDRTEIILLEAGAYEVCVSFVDGKFIDGKCASAYVPPNGSVTVSLR